MPAEDFADLLLRYTDVVSPARQRVVQQRGGGHPRGQEHFHDANHPVHRSALGATLPVRMVEPSQSISVEFIGGGVSSTERHHYNGVKQTAQKSFGEAVIPPTELDAAAVSVTAAHPELGLGPEQDAVQRLAKSIEAATLSLQREAQTVVGRFRHELIAELNETLRAERDQHSATVVQLRRELEEVKELARTYKDSAATKDDVIADLKQSLAAEQQRSADTVVQFEEKTARLVEEREAFQMEKAARHYADVLKRQAFRALHGTIKSKWRTRVQRACQAKSQEVCVMLQQDYEEKIVVLTTSLNEALSEIEVYKQRKMEYEENMKKAFMRGVCALNMEAMTMWKVGDEEGTAAMLQMPPAERSNVAHSAALLSAPHAMAPPPRNRPPTTSTAAKMRTSTITSTTTSTNASTMMQQASSAATATRQVVLNSAGLRNSSGNGNGNGSGSRNSGRNTRRPPVMVERHDFTVVP